MYTTDAAGNKVAIAQQPAQAAPAQAPVTESYMSAPNLKMSSAMKTSAGRKIGHAFATNMRKRYASGSPARPAMKEGFLFDSMYKHGANVYAKTDNKYDHFGKVLGLDITTLLVLAIAVLSVAGNVWQFFRGKKHGSMVDRESYQY